MAKQLRRTGTSDKATLSLEDSAAQQSRDMEVRMNQMQPDFIKSGKMISGIEMTANTAKAVSHGFGKTPSGGSMMHCHASTPISFSVVSMDSSKITIITNEACTLDLWVY